MGIEALPFAEALAWLRARVPMSDDEFAALDASARHRAFAIAGVAQASVAADAWQTIDDHLARGFDVPAVARALGPKLTGVWGVSAGRAGARLELIARNAAQSAFNAGRWAQATRGLAPKIYPYLRFIAVRDLRTSAICGALHGLVLPVGDPRWNGRVPPCHHACRSTFESLRKAVVDALGGPHEGPIPAVAIADEGFGQIPSLPSASVPLPALPAPLRRAYEAKAPAA